MIKEIKEAIKHYERFNRKLPTKLVRTRLNLSTPFIKIGPIPLMTYTSDKEGREKNYKHQTKKPPVLYYNPKAKVFLIRGGSIKVKDWMYD